jgi:AbiV family abortive infection protein
MPGVHMPKQVLTAQFFQQGIAYALEQCGLLLRDAGLLYDQGSYATAVVLAAFAREELGRSRILFDLFQEASKGKQISLEDVTKACADHVDKQEKAQLSTVMRGPRDSAIGKLLLAVMKCHPQSEEWKKAKAELGELEKRLAMRTPDDRHETRESALYVDAKPNGWARPSEIEKEFAKNFLVDAVQDYAVLLRRDPDSEFNKALQGWKEGPKIPDPVWPKD